MQDRRLRLALASVGSTEFESVVDAVLAADCLATLADELAIDRLVVQFGRRRPRSDRLAALQLGDGGGDDGSDGGSQWTFASPAGRALAVVLLDFSPDIDGLLASADVAISHAGAGSILASLRPIGGPGTGAAEASHRRPNTLVVVPNDTLMDNHQSELATQIVKAGWAIQSSPSTLTQTLQDLARSPGAHQNARSAATPDADFDSNRFKNFLDQIMGFAP